VWELISLTKNVGRRWYVEIVAGTIGAQAFVGTNHVATGNQVWDRFDLGILPETMREVDVLGELHGALLEFLERHSHLG
jgi:hypothetical protein